MENSVSDGGEGENKENSNAVSNASEKMVTDLEDAKDNTVKLLNNELNSSLGSSKIVDDEMKETTSDSSVTLDNVTLDSQLSNVETENASLNDDLKSFGTPDNRDKSDTRLSDSIEIKHAEINNIPLDSETRESDSEVKEVVLDSECIAKTAFTEEMITFVILFNKNKHDVTFNVNRPIKDLKDHLQKLINVPQSLQKIMIKGLARDDQTLKDLNVKSGQKIMVVGSKLDQILAVSSGANTKEVATEKETVTTKEPLCKQKMHKKVLDKGKPDDVMVGIKNVKDSLPPMPLSGMLNKHGGKVRLTFKLETDQLWISTKEKTEKVAMNSIKNIVNEPITGSEEYHVMGLQMGTTEASRVWIYWVPAQYVDAIKNTILGTWMP